MLFSLKKKKKAKIISLVLQKVTKKKQCTVFRKKEGLNWRKKKKKIYSAPTKLTQSMRRQSELRWQRLSFIYHWPGNLCQRNTSFKQHIEKKWHDSNSTLEYVHNHMLPVVVAQCMVTARLHHVVNVMDVTRNPARLKQRGIRFTT